VRIAIGSDEAGHEAKQRLAMKLVEASHEVTEAAAPVESTDHSGYAEQVAMAVLRRDAERGIIVTSRAIGASVAANRVPGIRAALCNDPYLAELGAKTEGMNVLVLAVQSLEEQHAQSIVEAYLSATLAPVEVLGGLPPRRLQRVFEYVREHITAGLSVPDLARTVGMSQYYFSKMFKMSTGTTPHQYVMRQRVDRAQELLRETQAPLAGIAVQVGFETQSHFTSVFRRLTGATPKNYRERHQPSLGEGALAETQEQFAGQQKSATAA
jgi:RpiB/LacA/LacB family sugar-phosphate isomerase